MNSAIARAVRPLALVFVLATLGCGGGGNRAKVTGKVTANGQPVTEGTLLFSPVGGEPGAEAAVPATAEIQSDGTFTVGTDKPGDGAAVGKHRVSYNAPVPAVPEWDGYGKKPEVKQSAFAGMQVQNAEVEVKPGENELSIEMVEGPAR